jgi:hypothetical protein
MTVQAARKRILSMKSLATKESKSNGVKFRIQLPDG